MLQIMNFNMSLFPLSEFPEDNCILPSFAGEGENLGLVFNIHCICKYINYNKLTFLFLCYIFLNVQDA